MEKMTNLGSSLGDSAGAAAAAAGLPVRRGYHLYGSAYFDPAAFRLEGMFLAVSAVYLLVFAVFHYRNRVSAMGWVRAAMPELQEEFALVASKAKGGKGGALAWNGAGEAALFATGRRSVDYFQAMFHFYPLHDPLTIFGRFVWDNLNGSFTQDRSTLQLVVTLPQTPDNLVGVFALVDKSVLRATRTSKRFDLSFAKLVEAENAASQRGLSTRWAILSENGDITDLWLGEIGEKGRNHRETVGIQKVLDDSPAGKWLESIVISDEPETKPPGPLLLEDRPRRITLTLRMPRGASQARETLPLLGLALSLADGLAQGVGNTNAPLRLRNDTVARLRKTREAVDKQLEEEATREDREREAEAKAEAKARADKEKFDKLSPAEQERRKEIERKRAQKKTMKLKR